MASSGEKVRVPYFWYDFAAGYISGVANIMSGQPFDICKVRMQSQGSGSFLGTLRTTVREEGVRKLWAGSTFPLIFYGICNSIVFAVNESAKQFFRDRKKSQHLAPQEFFLSGALAGVANSFISSPMEHVRIRLQTDKAGLYRNSFHAAGKIIKDHGLKGLFLGQQITVLREFILYGSYFSGYGILKQYLQTDNKMVLMSLGGFAGTCGWVSSFYIDNLKSKIQTDSFSQPRFPTWRSLLPYITPKELTKGFTAGFLRAYPVNAITFLVYEMAADTIYADKKK
mgnify:FL=1